MTKEEYLQQRPGLISGNNISIELFWGYYKQDNRSTIDNIQDFGNLFMQFMQVVQSPFINGLPTVLKKVREYFDNKFSVIELRSKEEVILKVY